MAAGSHISGTAGTPLSRMARQLSSRHAESRPAVCAAHSGHKTLSYPAADKNAHTSSQSACSLAHNVTCPSTRDKAAVIRPEASVCIQKAQTDSSSHTLAGRRRSARRRGSLCRRKGAVESPLINQANHWQSFAQARAQDPQCRINSPSSITQDGGMQIAARHGYRDGFHPAAALMDRARVIPARDHRFGLAADSFSAPRGQKAKS